MYVLLWNFPVFTKDTIREGIIYGIFFIFYRASKMHNQRLGILNKIKATCHCIEGPFLIMMPKHICCTNHLFLRRREDKKPVLLIAERHRVRSIFLQNPLLPWANRKVVFRIVIADYRRLRPSI